MHFEGRARTPTAGAALRGLEASSGLRLVVAQSDGAAAPAGLRAIDVELVGEDRPGIVSSLTRMLAESGVSVENLHTEIMGQTTAGKRSFKVNAHLLVPKVLESEALRSKLEALANEMTLDIALGERAKTPSAG